MPTREQFLRRFEAFSADIARLYSKPQADYRGRFVDARSVSDYLHRERHRFAEIAAWLTDPPRPGARLLDVGTAYGFLPVAIQLETGWKCEGLELAENLPVYCAFAQDRGLPLHTGRLGAKPLPLADRSFDAVIFSEVLEHLRVSPRLVFKELHRLLAPGGLLLVTTPNVARLANLAKLFLGRNVYEPFPENIESENITEHLTHIREYTMAELRTLLDHNGFAVTEPRYSTCMEHGDVRWCLTTLVPSWRGCLMVLARKAT